MKSWLRWRMSHPVGLALGMFAILCGWLTLYLAETVGGAAIGYASVAAGAVFLVCME